jgi:hypothetical protein
MPFTSIYPGLEPHSPLTTPLLASSAHPRHPPPFAQLGTVPSTGAPASFTNPHPCPNLIHRLYSLCLAKRCLLQPLTPMSTLTPVHWPTHASTPNSGTYPRSMLLILFWM